MLSLDKKSILKMTIPIMLGTFIQNIVMITDAILVNKLGTIPFDAANNAGLLYIVFFMLSKGLGDGSQIQIAKEYGKNNFKQINHTLNNSFTLQFIFSILFTGILLYISHNWMDTIVHNDEIGRDMTLFLDYRVWGLLFAGIQVSLMAFFIGIGKTKIIISSTILMASINIFLDFGLIYGYFGFPEMGLAGAALASTIAEFITLLYLIIFLYRTKSLSKFNFNIGGKLILYKTKLLLKLSWPLMLSGFLSITTWFIFFSFIEQRNAFDLEVSHVVRNLFFISFIPIFGFAASSRTYVSYYFGRHEFNNVRTAQKNLVILSILFYLVFFHGAFFYPELLVRLISSDPLVVTKSAEVLQIVFGSMFIFAIIAVFYNSVAAVGKTLTSLVIEIISISIYLIFAYYFTIKWEWDIVYVWTIEYVYFGLLGLFSAIFLIKFNSKNKKLYVK